MKYIAEIDIMPQKALLDPQGKAVNHTVANLGFKNVENIRIGKHICMEINAENKEKATEITTSICRQILSNPIMEDFYFVINEINK